MNTPKKYYSWSDIEKCAQSICLQMYRDNWRPDYIIGLTRGGLPLAVMISHMTNIRMETLKVKLRDLADNEDGCETNDWMAQSLTKDDFREGVRSFIEKRPPQFSRVKA